MEDNFIKDSIDFEDWPKTCHKCGKKINKTIFLCMHLILPKLEKDYQPTGEEIITIIKESYCKKCIKDIKTGVIIEAELPNIYEESNNA